MLLTTFLVDDFISSTTFCDGLLFWQIATNRYFRLAMRKSGQSLNLIGCIFSFEKWKESILFQVFPQLLINNFAYKQQNVMLTTKNHQWEKLLTTFCLTCQQPYTESQLPRDIFIPVVFCQLGGGGGGGEDRIMLTVEKEEASIFQSADLATTVVDIFVELYCLQDQWLTYKFGKHVSFLLSWINTVKM